MKKSLNRFTATALSAVMAALSLGSFPAFAESDTTAPTEVTIHFDIDADTSVAEDKDGNPQEINDITIAPHNSVALPKASLEKEGLVFNGWTVDGIVGYVPNETFIVGEEDVTLTPVWSDPEDRNYFEASYTVVIDGETIDTSKELKTTKYRKGEFVKVSQYSYNWPGYVYAQMGWICDETPYLSSQSIIVTDHDLNFTPNWLKVYKLTFTAGDVDRIAGGTFSEFDRIETLATDLAESSRFSRNGFRISGWLCSYDNQIYKPLSSYRMPSSDVTMTAVWEPITYNVVFNNGVDSNQNIKIAGKTDTTIICPEINVEKSGYYFAGWSYEGVTYQPGDEFFIKGAISGSGIALSAVWKKGSAPKYVPGDADCNNEILINDAVLILQSIASPDKYGIGGTSSAALTKQGAENADCYLPGSGVTTLDALAVQQYLLGTLTSLPVIE